MNRAAAAAIVAFGALTASACSNSDPAPTAQQPPATNAPQQSQQPAPAAKLPDACTLLKPIATKQHVSSLDKHPLGSEGAVSACKGQNSSSGTVFEVVVRNQTLDEFRTTSLGGKLSNSTIAGHKGIVRDDQSSCDYSVELSPTSRVDFLYTQTASTGACAKSQGLAQTVAKELPPGQ